MGQPVNGPAIHNPRPNLMILKRPWGAGNAPGGSWDLIEHITITAELPELAASG
jgi:hypothetical protein